VVLHDAPREDDVLDRRPSGKTKLASELASGLTGNGQTTADSRVQGKAVSKLKSGRYKITVVDKTPARSFVVQQNNHSATTVSGVSFVGTRSVTLNLTAGQWAFYSSAGTKSKSSFIVVA